MSSEPAPLVSGKRPSPTGELDAAATGFLAELPGSARARLLEAAVVLDVPAGSVVYREIDETRLFVVRAGIVRAFVSAPDGRQVTFRYARRGDVLGLASALAGPAPLTIEALSDASLATLPVALLRLLVDEDPGTARVCARELARQLYQALDDIVSSAFEPVRQRITRHLLALAEPGADGRLVATVTRQGLADAAGAAREVVTRTLRAMADEGLVTPRRGTVVIDRPAAVELLAGRREATLPR